MAYLYDNQNPNAPVRANGKRFWGYPTRTSPVRVIVVHTAETAPSSRSAENVANFFTHSTTPASYHCLCDNDSDVVLLPDTATAFGVANFNSPALHISAATRAADWGKNPTWDNATLTRMARRVAAWCKKFSIPPVLITPAQARDGRTKGIISHASLDPTRRSDPGPSFPWSRFLAMVKEILNPPKPTPKPTPTPTPSPAPIEDDMPLTQDDINKVADAVARKLGFWDPNRDRFRSYHQDTKAIREGVREVGGAVGNELQHEPRGVNPA